MEPLRQTRHGDGPAADWGDFDIDYRLLMPDGAVKHIHDLGHQIEPTTDRSMVIVGA